MEEQFLAPFIENSGMIDLVGKDSHIQGTLFVKNLLRVDGTVDGEIKMLDSGKAVVVVGRTGSVKGKISAGTVIISGYVQGSIKASTKIRVGYNGNIVGTLEAPRIMIERGAFIKGDFDMEIPLNNPLSSISS